MEYLGDDEAFKHLGLVQCTSCELAFAFPPPPGDVLEVYNASYFAHAYGDPGTIPTR